MGVPQWLSHKESTCNAGDTRVAGLIPGLARSCWRKCQPTLVLLPGKSHGQRSLVGYSPWGHKESDTTEQMNWMNWILVQWFVQALYALRFVLSFCLFGFPLMVKAECGGNPVCWWLGLCFCFVCCLDEASCIGCYWWSGDAGSWIQMISFVWVLTIWYSLGFVLG